MGAGVDLTTLQIRPFQQTEKYLSQMFLFKSKRNNVFRSATPSAWATLDTRIPTFCVYCTYNYNTKIGGNLHYSKLNMRSALLLIVIIYQLLFTFGYNTERHVKECYRSRSCEAISLPPSPFKYPFNQRIPVLN